MVLDRLFTCPDRTTMRTRSNKTVSEQKKFDRGYDVYEEKINVDVPRFNGPSNDFFLSSQMICLMSN